MGTLVSCAALQDPLLTASRGYSSPGSYSSMECKIDAIMASIAQAGCDAAVLSAFGCGAFGNPPDIVAHMFHKVFERSSVGRVVFSILDDHNTGGAHNPRGNYLPF